MRRIAGLVFVAAMIAGPAQLERAEAQSSATSGDLLSSQRADIAVFREKFLSVDGSFTKKTRALAEKRLSQLEHATHAMSRVDFAVQLCRVAALADNAHTACLVSPVAREVCRQFAITDGGPSPDCLLQTVDVNFNSVPLGFAPFGTDFHVVATRVADADLLGARLVAVDGKSINSIRGIVRSFAGGTVAWRDLIAAGVLTSPDQLHAVGVSRQSAAVAYRLVTPNGRVVEREFNAGGAGGANEAWRVIPSPDRAPWAFQQPERLFRWRDAPDLEAVVIQIRRNMDAADQRIGDFLEQAESNRQRLGRHNVVLDMRFNDGGNLLLTREFMAKWPSRLAAPGRFFVLTSPKTMSAGMASIAYLKQAGKDRVVLVGEAPGERLMYFAEGRPIRLPHSGLFLRPATARNDYETGCRNYDDCFVALAQPGRPTAPPPVSAAAVDRMPVAVSSLEPDLPAPWTVESWLTGTDPAIDAVSHALNEKR